MGSRNIEQDPADRLGAESEDPTNQAGGPGRAAAAPPPKPTVILTGFGPFREHFINASWQVVQRATFPPRFTDRVTVVKREIPVAYAAVDRMIPQLWAAHRPILVVHCGVSAVARCLILESEANTHNYCAPDVDNCLPDCQPCDRIIGRGSGPGSGPGTGPGSDPTPATATATADADDKPTLKCGLDLCRVSETINGRVDAGELEVPVVVSRDAGRYLCEYIYCKSLEINPSRSVFIHVPPLDKPYSREQLADSLVAIVQQLVDQYTRKCDAGNPTTVTLKES